MESSEVSDHLRALEESLLDANVRGDAGRLSALLTDDFREVGASGRVYRKDEIVSELATEQPARLELTDFECELLSEHTALVRYRSARTADEVTTRAYRCSIWVKRADHWQMFYHQGTRAAEESMTSD